MKNIKSNWGFWAVLVSLIISGLAFSNVIGGVERQVQNNAADITEIKINLRSDIHDLRDDIKSLRIILGNKIDRILSQAH